MKKAPPPDPLRENFNNLGHDIIVYNFTEIILLLAVRNHRDAPPNGTLLPNRRLVSMWSFVSYIVCLVDCVITLL